MSMLPGRRKRSSQGDDSLKAMKAWKLEFGSSGLHGEDYDLTPLENGMPVLDLWDPRGDTLVYLSPSPLPNHPEPQASFRINSSPLLFACLAGYIQDVSPPGIPATENTINQGSRLDPDGLFLSVPTSLAEDGSMVGNYWRRVGDVVNRTQKSNTELEASPYPLTPEVSYDDGTLSSTNPNHQQPPMPFADEQSIYQVRYKLYFSRVAQETRSGHRDRKNLKITRLLDARNLFAFLDHKFLVASLERINAFLILEKLYLQLFIEPSISPASSGIPTPTPTPSAGSPPGSPRGGARNKLRKGYSTPPRTPPSPALPHSHSTIDDLPAKITLAESHLNHFIDVLKLDDVRGLPEGPNTDSIPKAGGGLRDSLEVMYVGEKWRSSRLFLEGYLHTVGSWEQFKDSHHPLVEFLSPMTLSKLDRAVLDLSNRRNQIYEKFCGPSGDFAYPAMFSGVGKYPRFKRWRLGFSDTRELFIKHLKWMYGTWPPRPGRQGKGGLSGGETGGLNREVLKQVEKNVALLWELVVNWDSPRYPPGGFAQEEEQVQTGVTVAGGEEYQDLRALLEESDRATPPVQPRPMFDMPKLPIPPVRVGKKNTSGGKKEKSKKIRGDATMEVLRQSWNSLPSSAADTGMELVHKYKEMEILFAQNKVLGSVQGRTIEDLQEYRKGCWIFIYAILQSLPMLVVDAPIVRWSDGCENFLCIGWKSALFPWEDRDTVSGGAKIKPARGTPGSSRRTSTMWASAPGGISSIHDPMNLSELAAAAIVPGGVQDDDVGASYHRSYCWARAAKWYVRWEENQRIKWEEEQNAQRTDFEFHGSDYGSGEGSVGHMSVHGGTTSRKGTPTHLKGGVYGWHERQRVSSSGSGSPSESFRSLGDSERRTPSMVTMAMASGQVADIPEILLPSTRDKRMSSFRSASWTGLPTRA